MVQTAVKSPLITMVIRILKRIVSKINLEKINTFIDGVEGISDLHKDFYKSYLHARYELIIRPSLEVAEAKEHSKGGRHEKM